MKCIISTTDKSHKEILQDHIHLFKTGDTVEVRNNFCKRILTVKNQQK